MRVIKDLQEVMLFYDHVNRIISLGVDISLRRRAVKMGVRRGDLVLDAGSGMGMMTKILLEEVDDLKGIVQLDPLKPMLIVARYVTLERCEQVLGVFEHLPFRSGVFDSAVSGFAIRDAYALEEALSEIRRVLKADDCRLAIAEIGKPDNLFARFLADIYWRFIAIFLAYLIIGKRAVHYLALHRTYRSLPTNRILQRLIKDHFDKVYMETWRLGAAVIFLARCGK